MSTFETDGKETADATEEPPRKPRRIALIGKAPDSVPLAPYDDPEWEIWILNTLGFLNEVPRWDRQFELHDLELTKAPEYGEYYQWLAKQERPVFIRDAPPDDFRNGVQFPLGEIQECFERLSGRTYLTNTVSLMVALVLLEHMQGETVEDLGLWGINMAQQGLQVGMGHAGQFTSEYARQRPSVEYWLGVAEGLGLQVHLPVMSDILKSPCIYGWHTTDAQQKMVVRKKELEARVAHAQQREQQGHDEAIFLAGALEGMSYDFQWIPGGLTNAGDTGPQKKTQ